MKKIVYSTPAMCSFAMSACLTAYMQQTDEQ